MAATGMMLVGCASTGTSRTNARRVAVLPLKTVGIPEAVAIEARRGIGREVARHNHVISDLDVDRTIDRMPVCRESEDDRRVACAVRTGNAVKATHVLVGSVAGIGQAHVVRLRVVNINNATVVRSVHETGVGDPRELAAKVGKMAGKLLERPRSRRWYTRWWVWALASAAVVAGVVVPVVLLNQRDPADVVQVP